MLLGYWSGSTPVIREDGLEEDHEGGDGFLFTALHSTKAVAIAALLIPKGEDAAHFLEPPNPLSFR